MPGPGAPRDGSAITEQLAANRPVTWCKEWGASPQARRARSHGCAGNSRELRALAAGVRPWAPRCAGASCPDAALRSSGRHPRCQWRGALVKALYFRHSANCKHETGGEGHRPCCSSCWRSSSWPLVKPHLSVGDGLAPETTGLGKRRCVLTGAAAARRPERLSGAGCVCPQDGSSPAKGPLLL